MSNESCALNLDEAGIDPDDEEISIDEWDLDDGDEDDDFYGDYDEENEDDLV